MKIWVTAWSLCNSAMLLTWNVLHPLTIIHHILWNVKYATGNHPDTTVTILFKGLGFDRRTPDTRFRVSGILAIIYQVSLYVTTNKQLSHKLDTDMPHCAGRKKKKKKQPPTEVKSQPGVLWAEGTYPQCNVWSTANLGFTFSPVVECKCLF